MFRTIVSVTKYTTQGWDNYVDDYEESFESETKAGSIKLAKEYVENLNNHKLRGDFGIILTEYVAEIKNTEQFSIV